ncbi:LOW QUALITY PROTEIN: coiled-coil domain-containing protein 124-like [Corvus moneduloides]|nr:LOW QUALITY PROTEIN: coiled-coil domain-containing protein 124-like [Corvus moneduloides]
MPKKFQGENTKSAAARARRAEAKAAADARRQQELEDALWKEEDKHVLRKEQRKEEREKRRLEQLERKKELQRLLEEEDSKLKGKSPKQGNPGKITRAQIEESIRKEQQRESADGGEKEKEKEKSHLELPLEENLNRRLRHEGAVEARSIEEAIAALSVSQPSERHPERRLRFPLGSAPSLWDHLDTKGTNYKYEVPLAGPALELHNCMAKLLAHPLQRPCQSHAAYGLLDGADSPDSEATV